MAQTDASLIVPSERTRSGCRTVRTFGSALRSIALLVWKWSVPHRNSHRPDDGIYLSVWSTKVEEESIRNAFHAAFPDIPRDQLPDEEEPARLFLRERFLPLRQTLGESMRLGYHDLEEELDADMESGQHQLLQNKAEEAWQHISIDIRHVLAAANAYHLEKKLQLLLEESYHPRAGLGNMTRSAAAVSKTFRMWRKGLAAAVSWHERVAVNTFFVVLAFSAVYPDVAAGFIGERSYNQRSIGSRIVTLYQLYFLWTFPFHSFWLLFNWSLERLLGAFVGNSVYALVVVVPAFRASYSKIWFRTMMLGLSMSWQIVVQFSPTVRDNLVRLFTRHQMRALRKKSKKDGVDWTSVDKHINQELVSHKEFVEQQAKKEAARPSWHEVPTKVRMERYIHFTSTFELGRSAEQLIALLKDDMEGIINTCEDYRSTAPRVSSPHATCETDQGHVEPRTPKFFLVFFDIIIFAYVCYSFWTQPFTFNTVVAYSTVVVVKQIIVALKRYQTIKSARRLFTNMVSINIIGMLLVSTPVAIDREVLANDGNMVALTLAMVFATLFLSEPIAPVLLTVTEKGVTTSSYLMVKLRHRSEERDIQGDQAKQSREEGSSKAYERAGCGKPVHKPAS